MSLREDLNDLENRISKDRPKKRKPKVEGSGFSKQKQILEESGYLVRKSKKKKIIKKNNGNKK